MSTLHAIVIVEAAHAAKLSIVSGQMGYTQAFEQGVKLCAFETAATSATPPTHYMINAVAMPTVIERNFYDMSNGDYMPQVIWADVPGITEAEANAAANALEVLSNGGGPLGDLDTHLEAKGLKRVPEPAF